MSVGGNGLQITDDDINEIPSNQPLMFLPDSAGYCNSKINPFEIGTVGNVGIVILNLTKFYYHEKICASLFLEEDLCC
jgi:hypothetical protein